MLLPRMFVAGAVLVAASASVAREQARAEAAAGAPTIESCVDRQPIRFRADERRVVLDAVDAATVSAALSRRYPVLERDGMAPQRIVLWHKGGRDWLYVALLENPDKPADVCYTATFVAARVAATGPLLVKYFGAALGSD